jgi:hypothetical protein
MNGRNIPVARGIMPYLATGHDRQDENTKAWMLFDHACGSFQIAALVAERHAPAFCFPVTRPVFNVAVPDTIKRRVFTDLDEICAFVPKLQGLIRTPPHLWRRLGVIR